jgi:hypothetical protein
MHYVSPRKHQEMSLGNRFAVFSVNHRVKRSVHVQECVDQPASIDPRRLVIT